MAKDRRPPADRDAEARRDLGPAATNEPREGRMAGEQEEVNDAELERFWEDLWLSEGVTADARRELYRRYLQDAHYQQLMGQEIRLKDNGIRMPLGRAQDVVLALRALQEQEPDAFLELVRMVKPRGATHLPEPTAAMAKGRLALKKAGWIADSPWDVNPLVRAVLDAAYLEREGIVLRNPVVLPSREFVEELMATEREVDRRVHRYIREGMEGYKRSGEDGDREVGQDLQQRGEEERRRKGSGGEGPSL